ncbi:hypothetical protein ACWE42_14610 [Sutcliffiella cohnii]
MKINIERVACGDCNKAFYVDSDERTVEDCPFCKGERTLYYTFEYVAEAVNE